MTEAMGMLDNCHEHARLYSLQTYVRLSEENSDFLGETGLTPKEWVNQSTFNLCLPLQKRFAAVYRQTEARRRDDVDVKDTIRRLYNGGDHYHPYV